MSERKPPSRPADGKGRKHREKLLDEALEQSFPASDPPSIVSPHPAGAKPEDD
jgi:hypothetical protein